MPQSVEQNYLAGVKSKETHISSRQLSSWDEKIKQEALFSARTTSKAYLDRLKAILGQVASGKLTPQVAQSKLQGELKALGYDPLTNFKGEELAKLVPSAIKGSIQDLSSSRRIQLILDTNIKRARSMGQVASSTNPLLMMTTPAWQLTRTGMRKQPRGDWKIRWAKAGESVGWKGALRRRFIALKTSPIWDALGKGAGGFDDALGSPYPPFAFGSGLAWVGVSRGDWSKFCKSEGVPDGLEDVYAKVKELKKAESEKITLELPKMNLPHDAPEPKKIEPQKKDNPIQPMFEKPKPAPKKIEIPEEEEKKYLPSFAKFKDTHSEVYDSPDVREAVANLIAERKKPDGNAIESLNRYIKAVDKVWTPTTLKERRNDEIAKKIGAKHTIAPIAISSINPNFNAKSSYSGQWTKNCQRCVPCYEMTRRGYAVTAKPLPKARSNNDIMYGDRWKDAYILPPKLSPEYGEVMKHWKNVEDVERIMSEWGDGARAEINIKWKNKNGWGHVFFAEQVNGRTYFQDPQNTKANARDFFKRAYTDRSQWGRKNMILRIDKLDFSDKILDCIQLKGDNK